MLVSATGKLIMFCLVDFWNQQLEGLLPAQAQLERFQRLQRVVLAHLDAAALGREGAGPASGGAAVASPDEPRAGAAAGALTGA